MVNVGGETAGFVVQATKTLPRKRSRILSLKSRAISEAQIWHAGCFLWRHTTNSTRSRSMKVKTNIKAGPNRRAHDHLGQMPLTIK